MSLGLVEVLQLLRYELNWLEQSGYEASVSRPAPAQSPSPFLCNQSCLNFQDPIRRHSCHECALSMFVPKEHLTEEVPCHFIPLNGETVATLLEKGDRAQLAAKLEKWLKNTIARLEAVLEAQIGQV